jgi:hypothetical protein
MGVVYKAQAHRDLGRFVAQKFFDPRPGAFAPQCRTLD